MQFAGVNCSTNIRWVHRWAWTCRRLCSSTKIIYEQNGNPAEVLKLSNEKIDQNAIGANEVFVRWMASPINPSDINQIQGVYPIKPPLPAVAGNEGCARVEKIGSNVRELKVGDIVLPTNAGLGTWLTHGIYQSTQLFPIDSSLQLDSIATAMLQVNPSTAYRMLHDYAKLIPGDIVVQNGGNSAVGRFVIQMCRNLGFQSISVVRDRPQINEMKDELKQLGATEVFTEEEFAKAVKSKIGAKLALNCVGGKSTIYLIRALANGGCMVTYGGMSKNPVQVPTSSLIFNDITLHGFWMSRWYNCGHSEERANMYNVFDDWYKSGKLSTPPVRKWKIEEFKEAVENAMEPMTKFKHVFVYE
ncbi:hypothetical protein niasHS_013112 [Heterodera schachtii]|uniref:Enoyl-[acyl-carrier-protein] reductase, mitochondrial n=1 Tax=Heterodera schachtii TaxID=97005 RepID=A0ABD2ILN2_HETSC